MYTGVSIEVEASMGIAEAQYVVDSKGNRTAIILSIKQFEQIMGDLHDLAIVAERRAEETITLDEMKRRLAQDGP